MYFLDTDTLTWAHAGQKKLVERIKTIGQDNIATTVVTAIEVLRGRQEHLVKAGSGEQLLLAQQLLTRSEELLKNIHVELIDRGAAQEFDRLRTNKGIKKIGRTDLLIASIVLAANGTLVTRNLKHFRFVPNLRLENWVD